MLNPIGPNAPLQARKPTSLSHFPKQAHFEEELLEESGLPKDLLEDRT
jgi:hypothetical protein